MFLSSASSEHVWLVSDSRRKRQPTQTKLLLIAAASLLCTQNALLITFLQTGFSTKKED